MIHITDVYTLKARVDKLKHQIDQEYKTTSEKELAHKYVNKVMNLIDELVSLH